MRMRRTALAGLLIAWCAVAAGCRQPEMETRTFRLQELSASAAASLLEPYVSAIEGSTMSLVQGQSEALTIRMTPAGLDRIEEVLAEFDRPTPSLGLRFRVIEADGFETDDEALAEVLPALREVLGFEGYRSLGEAQAIVSSYGHMQQVISADQDRFTINSSIGDVRVSGEAASVDLSVRLDDLHGREILSTRVTVPVGRTVVLGTSKPSPQRGAYILTVEPTFSGE